MTARHPPSPLGKYAAVGQAPQPMTREERRRYLRRAWLEQGWCAFQRGDVNDLLWDLLKREATRLYGERRT